MSTTPTISDRSNSVRKLVLIARACVIAFGGMSLLAGAAWWVGGPVIPAPTLKALRGSKQSDVRRVLGEPSNIMDYGDWIYDRPLNPGWVAIAFDEDGSVRSVNDEQADPALVGSGSWHK